MPSVAFEHATQYAARGWCPIPVPFKRKGPNSPGWQKLRIGSDQVSQHFNGKAQNVGVLLGEPSGWLVDIDLDAAEARDAAPEMLPATLTFGRASNPRSHWLYRAEGAKTVKFADPHDGKMLLELRSTGLQTVFPGSVHTSGETIDFDSDGEPLTVTPAELRAAAGRLATCAMLLRAGIDRESAAAAVERRNLDGLTLDDKGRAAASTWLGLAREAPRAAAAGAHQVDELERRIVRARAYLARMPEAIQGQGGSLALLEAALALCKGFSLPQSQALELLRAEYNPRCQPEWSDKELEHKVADAAKSDRVPDGYLLTVEPPRPSRPQPTPATFRAEEPAWEAGPPDLEAPLPEPPAWVAAAGGVEQERPSIRISTREREVVDQAIATLAPHEQIYQRGGTLVHVVRDEIPAGGRIIRACGAPRIVQVSQPRLREALSDSASWMQGKRTEEGMQWVPAHPPEWAVRAVEARGTWPGVRQLEAVVETPVLRPDGTVLEQPGFDPTTGLLYIPSAQFAPVPQRPSREEAQRALAELAETVSDFPFASSAHRAAWFAALLTPFARYAFGGPAPLNLIDANVRGAGKSLLADVISEIVTGRPMARMAPSEDDAEERKRITSLAMSGDQLVLIDNVAGALGTASLDSALTATVWVDRLLGSNTNVRLPLLAVWFATGNNVSLRGDLSRRCLHVRLESPEENPEIKTGFAHPHLLEWVREQRARLVVAALTVLRAYDVAGRPPAQVPEWGSFEGWSGLVRAAVVWAGEPDPGSTRQELQAVSDSASDALADLVVGWAEVAQRYGGRCTVSQAISELEAPDSRGRYEALRAALGELCPTPAGKFPSAKSIGKALAKYRGRVVGGRAITRAEQKTMNGVMWSASPPQSHQSHQTTPAHDSADLHDSVSPVRGRDGQESYLERGVTKSGSSAKSSSWHDTDSEPDSEPDDA